MKISTEKLFVAALAASTAMACSTETPDTRTVGQLAVERAGEALQGTGACAALTQVDGDCPIDLEWESHGQYVSCVAKYLSARVESGDLPDEAMEALVAVAAGSDVGASRGGRPDFAGPGGAGGNDEGQPTELPAEAIEALASYASAAPTEAGEAGGEADDVAPAQAAERPSGSDLENVADAASEGMEEAAAHSPFAPARDPICP